MHVAISEVFPYSSFLIDVMSLVTKYGHDPFVQIIVIYIYIWDFYNVNTRLFCDELKQWLWWCDQHGDSRDVNFRGVFNVIARFIFLITT